MHILESTRCLTRVLIDAQSGLEVGELRAVRERIQSAVRELPREQRELVAQALFDFALSALRAREARNAG